MKQRCDAMKHASTKELYAYWNALRGSQPAPRRNEINPGAIPRVLPDIFLLDVSKTGTYHFRLAGTRICALFGRELKGESFASLWEKNSTSNINELLNTVLDEHAAIISGAEGLAFQDRHCELELVMLPLAAEEGGVRILGALSAHPLPSWFAVHHISTLRMTTLRLAWPSRRSETPESLFTPTLVSPLNHIEARKIGPFLVYEGGL